MKPLAIVGIILAGIIILGGTALVSKSNTIITTDAVCEQMAGQVNSALQRRLDLIPNLVETVKGYASHENETLTAVIAARASATQVKLDASTLTDPAKLQQFNQAQGQLSAALGKLMVVSEQYPNLKADKNFQDLMAQLEGTENRIKIERDNYNKAVTALNVEIRTFPGSLVNSLMAHVKERQVFQAEEAAQAAPKVSFGKSAPAVPAAPAPAAGGDK
ncbi:MAG TPA: LemA family protein [Humidesulfovibrio sp.]|uniref:LemA family protein n=1 Tax=Humidesulfovibrio sp. TaxID=2910988 RepID=UPI002B944DA3|nr:LemA family protein [Humidesulfovibrio sp.]HWR04914.1 LemA family protein [Humidesulfovibrio sp.]